MEDPNAIESPLVAYYRECAELHAKIDDAQVKMIESLRDCEAKSTRVIDNQTEVIDSQMTVIESLNAIIANMQRLLKANGISYALDVGDKPKPLPS